MGKFEFEATGVPVVSPDEDYFKCPDGYMSMTKLLQSAGADPVDGSVVTAFGYMDEDNYDEFWREYVDDYRKTGRENPPLYRVKISVTVELLPEDIAKAHWDRWRVNRGIHVYCKTCGSGEAIEYAYGDDRFAYCDACAGPAHEKWKAEKEDTCP